MNSHFESGIHFFLLRIFPKNPSKPKLSSIFSKTTHLRRPHWVTYNLEHKSLLFIPCAFMYTRVWSPHFPCATWDLDVWWDETPVLKPLNLNQNFPCCVRSGSRDAVGGTVASYCPDSLGIAVQFPVAAGDISPLQSVQTRSAGHATACSLGMANFPQSYGIRDMKLTTHCGEYVELYLCSPISFTVCRETPLSLLFRLCFCVSE
jgi:hypothetical protein